MHKIYIILIAIVFLWTKGLFAQVVDSLLYNDLENEKIEDWESVIDLLENTMEGVAIEETDLYEDLELPIVGEQFNINDLTEQQAFKFLHLSDYQYYHLKKYIFEHEEILSLYELAAVEGFDYKEVKRLSPYVCVQPMVSKSRYFKGFFKRSNQRLLLRYGSILERKDGYDTTRSTHYLGSPSRLLFKYTFSSGENFSLGIAGEKDPGEQWGKGAQKYGFDFYSGHVQIKNISCLKSLILGDYKVTFGQGLTLGNALRMGVGTVEGIRQDGTPLRSVTAMNESQFFRGGAVLLGNYRYSALLFYSYRYYDARVNDTIVEDPFVESAISILGNYRTPSEVKKRHTIPVWVAGGTFSARWDMFRLGFSALFHHFPCQNFNSGMPYQQFYFQGSKGGNVSLDYQALVGKVVLFGEMAMAFNKGLAWVQGAIFKPHPRLHLSLMFRRFGKKYYALYGGAYARNSKYNNELGCLINATIFLLPKVTLYVSSDFYEATWLKYNLDKPTRYADFSLKVEWSPTRKFLGTFQYKIGRSYVNRNNGFYNEIDLLLSHKLLALFRLDLSEKIKIKSGVNLYLANNHEKKIEGVLLYQDLILRSMRIGLTGIVRMAIFDSDEYRARLFAYENDLTQSFTIASYYGKGVKVYGILQYKWKFINFQCKISRLIFRDRVIIGSGLEQIKGNHKTEVKMQLQLSF